MSFPVLEGGRGNVEVCLRESMVGQVGDGGVSFVLGVGFSMLIIDLVWNI